MNLLKETQDYIQLIGKQPSDIIFIGSQSSGHSCTWDEFIKLSDVEYDDGYGGQEVACDLIIVFAGGEFISRHEYDGSECWSHTALFKMPIVKKPIQILVSGDNYWASLEELNETM